MTEKFSSVSPSEASGNPFKTRELVEQRWRQRRQVRCVPDFVFGSVPEITIPAFNDVAMRQLVELHVRERAEKEITDDLTSYLAACEIAERTQGFTEVLNGVSVTSPLREFADDVAAEARAAKLAEPAIKIRPTLFRFLFLNFVADNLADDAYRDPRREQLGSTTYATPSRAR